MSELIDLHIRITAQELADWGTEATEFGLTLTDWIRDRCQTFRGLTPQSLQVLRDHIHFDKKVLR